MISVVAIEPKTPANIGAIARAMKNFGFEDLVIVNPRCEPMHEDARKLAKHGLDIIEKARICGTEVLKEFDYKIATTAKLGTDYNIPRSPLTPEQLANKIAAISPKKKIAILIGREDIGLTNKEIADADFTVSIPAAKGYPTLSISHATAIMLYEIFKAQQSASSSSHILPISGKEKELLVSKINEVIDRLPFSTKEKRATQKKVWKRTIGKALLTKREAFAMFGFFRKIK